jgi:elongation factor P
MISATQLRPGMVVKFNNELYSIFSVNHRTPGNLRGFVQVKMRSLRSGSMTEHRFSSEDKVEKAVMEEQQMEYLYDDGEFFYFMNTESFEQMHLMKELLGDAIQYLIPQLLVSVEFYEGKPISVELPATVDLTVVETEPGMKGASVSNVTKPAKLETGLVVQVPPFITEGEKIRGHLPGTRVASGDKAHLIAARTLPPVAAQKCTCRSKRIRSRDHGSGHFSF